MEALKQRQKEEIDEVLEQHKKLDEDTEQKIESAYKRTQALEERRENQISRERGGPTQGYYMRLVFP